jgi:hypothetical protein
LESEDHEELGEARQGYEDLLDSFYAEVSDLVPLKQMNAARRNPEYYLRLIELALAYFIGEMEAEEQVQ